MIAFGRLVSSQAEGQIASRAWLLPLSGSRPRCRPLLPVDRRVHPAVGSGGVGVLRQVPTSRPTRRCWRGSSRRWSTCCRRTPSCSVASSSARCPIATVLSARTGLPALFVRKKAEEYGTCKLAEGPDVAGRRVTLVEDVITTGGRRLRRYSELSVRRAPLWRRSSARSTAARRGRTRWKTWDSRCVPCSTGLSWTLPGVSAPLGALPLAACFCPAAVSATRRRSVPPRGPRSPARVVDVVSQPRHPSAEGVPEEGDAEHPDQRADGAPHEEPATAHAGDAGHHRDVGAHERHEAADHQALLPCLSKKRVSGRSTSA